MSIATKVLECKTCQAYAVKITGSLYNDIVSDAIIRILKREAKGVFEKDYRNYYYSCLMSAKIDKYRREQTRIKYVNDYNKGIEYIEQEFNMDEDNEIKALEDFLNNKDEDKELQEEIKNLLYGNITNEIKIQLAYKKIKDGYNLFNDI